MYSNLNAWTSEFGEDCCPAKPAQSHPLGNVGDVNSSEAKCEGIYFELLATRHRPNICSFDIVLAWQVNLHRSCLAESLRPSPVFVFAYHCFSMHNGLTMFNQFNHGWMQISLVPQCFLSQISSLRRNLRLRQP